MSGLDSNILQETDPQSSQYRWSSYIVKSVLFIFNGIVSFDS